MATDTSDHMMVLITLSGKLGDQLLLAAQAPGDESHRSPMFVPLLV